MIFGYSIKDILTYGLLYLSNQSGVAPLIISMILICVAGYLIGGVNTAIILSKVKYKKDIREYGSGNAGLTNVLRTFGKKAALITLLGDIGKTGVACLTGAVVLGQQGAFLAGFASVIGHMWPVWFRFKGGKGVLSLASVMLFCCPKVFVICFTLFFIIVAFSKYISLGAVLCALLLPLILPRFISSRNFITIPLVIVCLLIIWKHRTNLARLRDGKENKVHLGKNGGFLPKPLLIAISLVLVAASVLLVVFSFKTENALTYKSYRMTSSDLRIIFINEKYAYFDGAEPDEEHDEEIMQNAIKKAGQILVFRSENKGESMSRAGETYVDGYFSDLTVLPGYTDETNAEQYCRNVYGTDITPNDVRNIIYMLKYSEEQRAKISDEAADALLAEAEDGISVSGKIRESIINKY